MVFRDRINDPVVISEELFRDRRSGGWKVKKADREVYLRMLADTIKDPVEIWLIWKKGKDKMRLCKRYIGIYQDKQGKVGGFAVFDLIDDIWQGTTTYKPDNLSILDSYREGKLLYAKNKPEKRPAEQIGTLAAPDKVASLSGFNYIIT